MEIQFRHVLYLLILLFTSISGLIHFSKMNKALKFLVLFIITTTIVETIGIYCFYVYKYSAPIYNLTAPLRFYLLCLFYNYSNQKFRDLRLGIYTGVCGFVVAITNCIFLQDPFDTTCTNFLAIEAILCISMSLTYFYFLLQSDEVSIIYNQEFWAIALLLVFWSFSFFNWLLYLEVYSSLVQESIEVVRILNTSINYIIYFSIGIIFLLHKKNSAIER